MYFGNTIFNRVKFKLNILFIKFDFNFKKIFQIEVQVNFCKFISKISRGSTPNTNNRARIFSLIIMYLNYSLYTLIHFKI